MLLILATKKTPNNLKQPKPVEFFDRGYTESLDQFGENFHFNNIELLIREYQFSDMLLKTCMILPNIFKQFYNLLLHD